MESPNARVLFTDDVFDGEPPLGAIVTDARRDGLRIRRRHRAVAAAAGLAVVTALAAGLPAAFARAPHATTPVGPRNALSALPGEPGTVPLPPGLTLPLPDITVPAQHLSGDQVPVTAKALTQRLIDTLPPAATHGTTLLASTSDGDDATAVLATVTLGGLTGTVFVNLTPPGQAPVGCGSEASQPTLACREFSFPDGVRAVEVVDAEPGPSGGYEYRYLVDVQRADGVVVTVMAASYDMIHPADASAAPPLTIAQVAASASDPAWAWTAARSYVHAAESLRLTGSIQG